MTDKSNTIRSIDQARERDAEFLRDLAGRLFRTATPATGFDQGDTDQLYRIARALSQPTLTDKAAVIEQCVDLREIIAEVSRKYREPTEWDYGGLDACAAIQTAISALTPVPSTDEVGALREALRPFAAAALSASISGQPPFHFVSASDYEKAEKLLAGETLSNPTPSVSSSNEGEGLREENERLKLELDRFHRPAARNLSTSDPITPLPTFQPQHLRGLALTFREWSHAEMWGRPQDAELAARQVETAYLGLTAALSTPPSIGDADERGAGDCLHCGGVGDIDHGDHPCFTCGGSGKAPPRPASKGGVS